MLSLMGVIHMAKRKITPHKGGRTSKINVRITPKMRQAFDDISAKTGESQGDVLERLIGTEWEKLFSGQMSIPESAYRDVGKSETK